MMKKKLAEANGVKEILEGCGFKPSGCDPILMEGITFRKNASVRYIEFEYVIEYNFEQRKINNWYVSFDGTFDALEIKTQQDVQAFHDIFETATNELKQYVDKINDYITLYSSEILACKKLGWKNDYNLREQRWHKDVDLSFGNCRIEIVFDNMWNYGTSWITPINDNADEMEGDDIYLNDNGWFSTNNGEGLDEVTAMFQEMLDIHNEEVEKLKNTIERVKERK